MEPANIDWKRVDSSFFSDNLFEHFNAPKWVDLSSADDPNPGDDDAWFCRPDCRHPKTAEDFLQQRSPASTPGLKAKLLRSVSSVDVLMPLGDRNANNNVKRRGIILPDLSSSSAGACNSPKQKAPTSKKKFREDLENQNPNLAPSPAPHPIAAMSAKAAKEAVKSSAEKPRRAREVLGTAVEEEKEAPPGPLPPAQRTRLKSTLSARNLFAGKDILAQISEFCSEIKRMTTARREKSEAKADDGAKCGAAAAAAASPLLEKSRKKQGNESDSTTQCHSTAVQEAEKSRAPSSRLLQLQEEVRSCPPSPQRFPSPITRQKRSKDTPPPKPLRPARGILKEVVLNINENDDKESELIMTNGEGCSNIIAPVTAEANSLDVFWFLNPCTYLGR